MTRDQDLLLETVKLAEQARASGNHPFGALLADADGQILLTSGNTHSTDGGTAMPS